MPSWRTFPRILPIAAALLAASCCKHEPVPAPPGELPDAAEPPPESSPPRCKALGKEVTLGPASKSDDEQDFLPFATEIGKGAAYDDGFAIAALAREGQGTVAQVAIVSLDGSRSKLIKLGESHGDSEPPRVFASGKTVGAGMLEPAGTHRALRLARIDGEVVTWGAEFQQGSDESLAFDVGLQAERGVAAWDDIPKDRDVSGIFLATFDAKTFAGPTTPKVVTLPGTDADNPRVVPRPGGFWLIWVARKPEGADDFDARYRAEDLSFKWLEVVPLDERGAVTGAVRRIGSDHGHVLVYDVAEARDGSALVMWRDDDTPSGSAGGKLMRALVRLGGVDGPDVVEDSNLGPGAPNLIAGWLAISDAASPTRLAPLSPDGTLLDGLASEALMGNGEPEAARGDALLVARPAGLAMKLIVAKCSREVRDAGPDGPAAD
jgi:hypothetical protein